VDLGAIGYWQQQLAQANGDIAKLAGQFVLEFLNYNGSDSSALERQKALNNKITVSQSWVAESGKAGNEFMNAAAAGDAAFNAQTAVIAGVGSTSDSLSGALGQVSRAATSKTLAGIGQPQSQDQVLTVQQVLDGAAQGKPYLLLDKLQAIATHKNIADASLGYTLSDTPGLLKDLSIDAAVALISAKNKSNYTFAITDDLAHFATASGAGNALAAAQSVTLQGTDAAQEKFDLSGLTRGVIVDARGGEDDIRGSQSNDLLMGGSGTNQYRGMGGNDIMVLSNDGADQVVVSKAAAGGSFAANTHIYMQGFGPGDKIVVSQADINGNLGGSFTPDDMLSIPVNALNLISNDPLSTLALGYQLIASGIGVLELEGKLPAGVDLLAVGDGSELLKGVSLNALSGGSFVPGLHSTVWVGFIAAYASNNDAYIYYAQDTGNANLTADEIKLVAVVQAPSNATAGGWLTPDQFLL
jgi:hypothetical protein